VLPCGGLTPQHRPLPLPRPRRGAHGFPALVVAVRRRRRRTTLWRRRTRDPPPPAWPR